LKVCSATSQRGGKITKSRVAVPSIADFTVKTVKIEGSGWS
jgi:glycine cleavage system regulatory protein